MGLFNKKKIAKHYCPTCNNDSSRDYDYCEEHKPQPTLRDLYDTPISSYKHLVGVNVGLVGYDTIFTYNEGDLITEIKETIDYFSDCDYKQSNLVGLGYTIARLHFDYLDIEAVKNDIQERFVNTNGIKYYNNLVVNLDYRDKTWTISYTLLDSGQRLNTIIEEPSGGNS